jgi:hypothetical protein
VTTANQLDVIWEHDVLARRKDATYLQNYLASRYQANPDEAGFVLAVNAEWGYGKSFMLERWKLDAEFQGYPAVYFDAWKNDFTPDPLLAFISELEEGLTKHFKTIPIAKQQKEKALRILAKVLKPAATIIATTALKHATGYTLEGLKGLFSEDSSNDDSNSLTEETAIAAREASAKIGAAIKSALEPHKTVKEAIKRLKENIGVLVEHLNTIQDVNLPILVFVDELDRCRPDYAIELLEGIKHLFGVPGVTFVVATNISQLSESIKAVYGSGFDGQRYLQRFFDLQFTLSQPDNASFSKLALEKIKNSIPHDLHGIAYGLENEPTVHPSQGGPYETIDYVTFVLAAYADIFEIPLRDINQIVTMLEACLITLKNERVHIFFLVFLVAVYKLNPVIFKRISSKRKIDYRLDIHPLIEKGKHVEIIVNEFDEIGRRRGTKSVTVPNIVDTYFSFIEQTDFNGLDQSSFPQRNFDPSEYVVQPGVRTRTAPYAKYFAIVEQAGGFIERKKTR